MFIQELHFKPETYFYILRGTTFFDLLPKLETPLRTWKLTFLSDHLNKTSIIILLIFPEIYSLKVNLNYDISKCGVTPHFSTGQNLLKKILRKNK